MKRRSRRRRKRRRRKEEILQSHEAAATPQIARTAAKIQKIKGMGDEVAIQRCERKTVADGREQVTEYFKSSLGQVEVQQTTKIPSEVKALATKFGVKSTNPKQGIKHYTKFMVSSSFLKSLYNQIDYS